MANAVAMLAGVGLLSVCCLSSSFMAGAMGGDETPGDGDGDGDTNTNNDVVEKEYIVVDESHVSPLKGGYVETGAGNSIEDCRKLAYDKDYPAFGFRKAANTCWAIIDGEDTAGNVKPLADHAVGCVERGEDINTGCKTTKTNVIRARHYKGVTSFDNIECNSIPTCRAAATAAGANHFGWREKRGDGWVVTAPDISSTTPEFLMDHTIGCTDSNKRPPNC
tara:strand:+ start:987 stop:1649 length:663 start_codon:yes stop_codon:yes gene_type:complete